MKCKFHDIVHIIREFNYTFFFFFFFFQTPGKRNNAKVSMLIERFGNNEEC